MFYLGYGYELGKSILSAKPEAARIRYDADRQIRRKGQAVIDLPPENIRRWTIRRKAAVVEAVKSGQVTRAEICRRYQISEEEFRSWQRRYEAFGLPGLRLTRLQQYRRPTPGRGAGRCR
jgi:hypothetical protein